MSLRLSETNKALIKSFSELRGKMVEITKDPYEVKALEYFDFISWLESKIENRTFGEIVREKYKSNGEL